MSLCGGWLGPTNLVGVLESPDVLQAVFDAAQEPRPSASFFKEASRRRRDSSSRHLWGKRALELVEAIRVLNSEEKDAIQKATIVVEVPVQQPATDLEGVQVVTSDVSMNNAVISGNIDATKKASDVAISTGDVVKAEEAATDATSTAIQATSNAQIAGKVGDWRRRRP